MAKALLDEVEANEGEPAPEEELALLYVHRPEPERIEKILEIMRPKVQVLINRLYYDCGESRKDYLQVGMLGVWHALERFDPGRGVKFKSYALSLANGNIWHTIRDHGRLIRLPAWLQEFDSKMNKAVGEFIALSGEPPSDDQLAEKMGCKIEEIKNCRRAIADNLPQSLDATREVSDEATEARYVDEPAAPDVWDSVGTAICLHGAIGLELNEKERHVLREVSVAGRTQTEVAREMGISCNYACHLQKRAHWKLRNTLAVELGISMENPEEARVEPEVQLSLVKGGGADRNAKTRDRAAASKIKSLPPAVNY